MTRLACDTKHIVAPHLPPIHSSGSLFSVYFWPRPVVSTMRLVAIALSLGVLCLAVSPAAGHGKHAISIRKDAIPSGPRPHPCLCLPGSTAPGATTAAARLLLQASPMPASGAPAVAIRSTNAAAASLSVSGRNVTGDCPRGRACQHPSTRLGHLQANWVLSWLCFTRSITHCQCQTQID